MIQVATTGELDTAQRIAIEQARYTTEHNAPCANLIEKMTLGKGEKSVVVPKVGQMTASALVDGVDIGDAEDIHPKNKQEVGRRLGLAALHEAYGKDGEWSGPVFRGMTVAGNAARLAFDHAAGLKTADRGPVKGFAVAGADGKLVWADARIEGDAVVVSAPGVAVPTVVRYAWAANPVCNLVNGAGLPAIPFRTDAPPQ